MKILTKWLRAYLPGLTVSDRQLADDLTLRGIAVEGVFDLGTNDLGKGNGSLFEMDITTNRVDAMNHYGVAREAAIIYGLKLAALETSLPAAQPGEGYPVRIEAPELCGRFTARVLRGVTIRPSDGIVAQHFGLLGQKQISNAVDATNYVMLGMGQPTHAFDLDKVEGAIVVRRAYKGEKLKTLDEVERTLDPEDLVVADEKKALGLAGVMGGWDSRITSETKNVLVEAAWFDTASIRRSSKRHLIHTDASHRFERGADFNAPPVASALVSRILLEAGGEQVGEMVDVIVPAIQKRTANRSSIHFSTSEIVRLLGATEDAAGISTATAETILTGLGCGLSTKTEGEYDVTLPSWRLDLEREIDLIEEIARVYGYNRFQNTLPAFSGSVVELPWAEKETTIRRTLLALGWTEAISSTFCAASDAELFAPETNVCVAMGNPLSEEAGMLRPSLVPGMLTMLALNLNRDVEDVVLYELGTAFTGSTAQVNERPALAIGASGRAFGEGEVSFYDVKGTIETLLGKFATAEVKYDREGLPKWLHPGRSARVTVDGEPAGFFGQLHPVEAERRKLKQAIFVGEIFADRIYQRSLRVPAIAELSKFQAVRRDFSLLVPSAVEWASIEAALKGLGIAELRSFAPKEILREAKSIPEGYYSLLLGTVFQSLERTLREEELQEFSQKVIAAMESLGGRLRG
ncbi:phenylalanine--tRNA ligase subunit beta [Silvibacterium acidisoli]|uniref:phenylalanine--tRNA ligase subunit beta n=1 Tax=Acidobacteriaceae bacterium ZG23-2 TaxID=2883246 RepID=UPI00406C4B0A